MFTFQSRLKEFVSKDSVKSPPKNHSTTKKKEKPADPLDATPSIHVADCPPSLDHDDSIASIASSCTNAATSEQLHASPSMSSLVLADMPPLASPLLSAKFPSRTPTPDHSSHFSHVDGGMKIPASPAADKLSLSSDSLDTPHDDPHISKHSSSKFKLSKWKDKALLTSGKFMAKASEFRHSYIPGSPTVASKKHDVPTRVFGMPLVIAVTASQIDETCPLPAVVIRSIEFLEAKGMYEVGLYRIPGSSSAVSRLKTIFDAGNDLNLFLEDSSIDPHTVATLLKQFLREMPENILGSCLPEFLEILNGGHDEPIPMLASLARQLPLSNYYLLSWLCAHLARLAYYSDQNKMTMKNLALIFSWTLQLSLNLLTTLVEHASDLFPLTEDGQIPPDNGIQDRAREKKSPPALTKTTSKSIHSVLSNSTDPLHTSMSPLGSPTAMSMFAQSIRMTSPKSAKNSFSPESRSGSIDPERTHTQKPPKPRDYPPPSDYPPPEHEAFQSNPDTSSDQSELTDADFSSMVTKNAGYTPTHSRSQSMMLDSPIDSHASISNRKENRRFSAVHADSPRFVHSPPHRFDRVMHSPACRPLVPNLLGSDDASTSKPETSATCSADPFADPS